MAKLRKLTKKQWLLFSSAGLFVVLITTGLLLRPHKTPVATSPPAPQDTVITYSTDTPVETPPNKDTYKWAGKATDPKILRIPAIGVESFVQKVGVDQHKAVAVPNNIHMTGWFVNSVAPGQEGLSVIDGHVDGRQGLGVFARLKNLKPGDTIEVQRGNNTFVKYQVRRVVEVPTQDAEAALFSQDSDAKGQLNLITCTGNFDKAEHAYDQRVVVSAILP